MNAVFVASVWLLSKLGLSPYASDRRKTPDQAAIGSGSG